MYKKFGYRNVGLFRPTRWRSIQIRKTISTTPFQRWWFWTRNSLYNQIFEGESVCIGWKKIWTLQKQDIIVRRNNFNRWPHIEAWITILNAIFVHLCPCNSARKMHRHLNIINHVMCKFKKQTTVQFKHTFLQSFHCLTQIILQWVTI